VINDSAVTTVADRRMAIKEGMLLFALCSILVIVQTFYVGDFLIYANDVAGKREAMHHAIFTNTPIGSSWTEHGANGTNIRILSVYLVEAAHKLTGLDYRKLYILLDMGALLAALLVLFAFLRTTFEAPYCLIAILFFGSILPMTYAFHFYHPWDRLGLLLWVLTIWAMRDDRLILSGMLLVIAILNKHDALVLPALYFMGHISVAHWRRTFIRAGTLFLLAVLTFALLKYYLPSEAGGKSIVDQLIRNLDKVISMNITYPPLLGFSIPIFLMLYGWRNANQFTKASCLLALMTLLGPLLLLSNFHELRAEMGVMVLLIPAALLGLKNWLEPESD